MRFAIERATSGSPAPRRTYSLTEVVTPRTNAATVSAAENMLAAVSLPEPFSVEIGATSRQRWFLVRSGSVAMERHLHDALSAVYPQADLRPLAADVAPGFDPARCLEGEQVAACALALRAPAYLPLRTFVDADVAADRAPHAAQNDPLTGVLSALGSVPEGWRALAQVVLRPAPDRWARGYARMAVESPLDVERQRAMAQAAARTDSSGTQQQMFLLVAGMLALIVCWQVYAWYAAGDWWALAKLALGAAASAAAAVWLWLRFRTSERPFYDPKLVEEKISRVAFVAQVRLAVFAPAGVPAEAVRARVRQLASAYRQFSRPNGNGFEPLSLRVDGQSDPDTLCKLEVLPSRSSHRLPLPDLGGAGRAAPVLNVRELAGLWHLVQGQTEVPLLERTAARQWQPLPADVSRGCRVGVSEHQGRRVQVSVPDQLLTARHSLLVAKTQRGKSSLLRAFARHIMVGQPAGSDTFYGGHGAGAGGAPRGLLLVDPHRDLARALLGLVPPERRDDVVYLDVGAAAAGDHPFGLNLLDVALGWTGDKAVANALLIFKREFGRNWGPRMEDAFRWSLKTLWAANEALCRRDPAGGRERQLTVLQVPLVLADPAFSEGVLKDVDDPAIHEWWDSYYRPLTRTQRLEIINPVQTKVQKFAGTQAGRNVAGQPRSTIDPAAWLRDGKLVLLDTAKGVVGEDTAALIGGTLVNLFKEVVGEQAALPARERRRVTVIVDEFQSIPGADYEALLSEMVKYGANLILATQSLGYLETLDAQHDRALRAAVFANLDGLFAFQCSADDAEYLVRELGGDVDPKDLLDLPEHTCYAKLSARGQRLPVFSLQLDRPPTPNEALTQSLAIASGRRFGRPLDEVHCATAALHARISSMRAIASAPVGASDGGDDSAAGGDSYAPPAGGQAQTDTPHGAGGRRQRSRSDRDGRRERGERGQRKPKATAAERLAALGGSGSTDGPDAARPFTAPLPLSLEAPPPSETQHSDTAPDRQAA